MMDRAAITPAKMSHRIGLRHFTLRMAAITLLFALAPAEADDIKPASADTQECLRLKADPPNYFELDTAAFRKALQDWASACRAAMASDGADNPGVQASFARVLIANGQRDEALPLLRQAAAKGDADANVEIFGLHNSWSRGDPDVVPLVSRAEGEQALRKAAELGNAFAMRRLATLLARGPIVKRDLKEAIVWAEKSLAKPDKGDTPDSIKVFLGGLLGRSPDATERARGIALLESLGARGDAQAELAGIIRADDPVRARALLEESYKTHAGAARGPLADMLITGEGGPANVTRGLKLLNEKSDVVVHLDILARLYAQGAVVPKDIQKAVRYDWMAGQWNLDAQRDMVRLLAAYPDTRADYPKRFLYDAAEAAELGEPGALAALIDLKLSSNAQFADRAGGCALIAAAIKRGDRLASLRADECGLKP